MPEKTYDSSLTGAEWNMLQAIWPVRSTRGARQGRGTLALKLALERARELGLQRVLVTCDFDNTGSCRVIEANGGKLEGEFHLGFHDKPLRRYWITL